jgi:hypothetical protein
MGGLDALSISPFLVINDNTYSFSTIKHNRVLFSNFVQGAPTKDMHGMNNTQFTLREMWELFCTILQNVES